MTSEPDIIASGPSWRRAHPAFIATAVVRNIRGLLIPLVLIFLGRGFEGGPGAWITLGRDRCHGRHRRLGRLLAPARAGLLPRPQQALARLAQAGPVAERLGQGVRRRGVHGDAALLWHGDPMHCAIVTTHPARRRRLPL